MGKFSLYSIFKSILSKNNRIYLTLFLTISCIVVLTIYSNRWSSNIMVSQINIKGNKLLSKDEILSLLDNSVYRLKNKDVQLLKIKSEIERNPYVYKAIVMKKSLSQILIEVVERKPIAILVDNNGNLCFVDKNSVKLPFRVLPYLRDMPLIRNVIISNKINHKALFGAVEFINNINNENNISLNKYISDIIYNIKDKDYTCLTSVNFCKILLGKANKVKQKIELLKSFWDNKLVNLNMAKISYIDLRWKNRVVVKFLT